jgi:hypothetical protein
MKTIHAANPAHPCAAAYCIEYRRANLPDRIMHWCFRNVTPMAPCVHLRPQDAARADDAGRTNGAFCAKQRKSRAAT